MLRIYLKRDLNIHMNKELPINKIDVYSIFVVMLGENRSLQSEDFRQRRMTNKNLSILFTGNS